MHVCVAIFLFFLLFLVFFLSNQPRFIYELLILTIFLYGAYTGAEGTDPNEDAMKLYPKTGVPVALPFERREGARACEKCRSHEPVRRYIRKYYLEVLKRWFLREMYHNESSHA